MDTISRKDAIDALGERPIIWSNDDEYSLGARNQYDTDKLAIETVPSVQPEQRWIPVTERLPEKNVWVLVTFMMANGEVDTDIMRINRWDGGWDTHTFDMAYRETVIAWMPLPKPYGGEQE